MESKQVQVIQTNSSFSISRISLRPPVVEEVLSEEENTEITGSEE